MGFCRTLEFDDRASSCWRTAFRPGARRPARHHRQFIQNELGVEREKLTLLHQQDSQQTELLREHGAQQFELLKQQQATATGSTYTRRPETLKIDISGYKGADEDSLLRWFVELDDAIRACHIVDEQMQIAFAQPNLAGRAKTWALAHVFARHMSLGRWKSSSPC